MPRWVGVAAAVVLAVGLCACTVNIASSASESQSAPTFIPTPTPTIQAAISEAPTPTATPLPARFEGDVADLVAHADAYLGTDVRVTGDVGGKSEGAPYTWLVDRAADVTVLVLFDTRLYDGQYELSFEQAGEPAEVRGTFLDFTAQNIDVLGSPYLDGADVVQFMNRFGPIPSHLIIARRIITGSGVEYPPDG
ncbi:MAG TPA: hypothetical protein VF114_08220 [Candidatus Limnocylindria bacterium]